MVLYRSWTAKNEVRSKFVPLRMATPTCVGRGADVWEFPLVKYERAPLDELRHLRAVGRHSGRGPDATRSPFYQAKTPAHGNWPAVTAK